MRQPLKTHNLKINCARTHTHKHAQTDACGGHLVSSTGIIKTPNYPDLYPTNKTCVWMINAPLHHRIVLEFSDFDIEGNNVGWEE